jgi:hypothetical protein
MLHLKKYNEYNEYLNEGIINFLKKNMKKLMNSFSEDIKKNINIFTQKIENSKNIQESKTTIENLFTNRTKKYNEIKNYKNIKFFINEDLMLIYLILIELSQKFQLKTIVPNVFFQNNFNDEIKKIFNYNNVNDFQNSLSNNLKYLIILLSKKSGINIEEKLPETKLKSNELEGENLEADESFKKFKETTSDFRINGLIKPLLKELENIFQNNNSNNKELENIINTIEGSNNKDSLMKMLKKIISSKKETLINLRDILGLDKNDTPL